MVEMSSRMEHRKDSRYTEDLDVSTGLVRGLAQLQPHGLRNSAETKGTAEDMQGQMYGRKGMYTQEKK